MTRQGSVERWIALYKDDGPSGIVGQATSVTSPWWRLYVYEGPTAELDAVAYKCFLADRREHAGRRRPRIEGIFSDLDGNIGEGPIVPVGAREDKARRAM